MGAICNTVERQSGPFELVQDTSTKANYQPVVLDETSYLQGRISDLLKNDEKFHSFEQGKQILKHKTKDLYYFGQWDNNGYPKGKGIQFKQDQYLYYGDFDSVPSGKGVYQSLNNRFAYEGDFSYGRIQGHGKAYSKQGLYSFEGQFNKNSQPVTGTAIINYPQDQSKSYSVSLNNYPQNKAKIVYKDGRQYLGEIRYNSFAPQGTGIAKFLNGSIYEGKWENGEYHGEGKFTWPDGSAYEGNYQHGKKHGFGTFRYVSRKFYRGNWQNGIQNGEGTLYSQQGTVLKKGFWVNGAFDRIVQQ